LGLERRPGSLPARRLLFVDQRLPGNIFEDYELGGYAAWSLGPKYPDFIDGRGNNPDLGIEQFNLYSQDPDSQAWQSEADRWNLNVLLVATGGLRGLRNIDPYKFCQSADWRPIYMDDVSLVFLRNRPGNSSWITRLQIDCSTQALTPPVSASRSALHEFYVNSGEFFCFASGWRRGGVSWRADALYRDDPNVHLLKGLLFGRRQQYAKPSRNSAHHSLSTKMAESGARWRPFTGIKAATKRPCKLCSVRRGTGPAAF
jgi:hypothetical protein